MISEYKHYTCGVCEHFAPPPRIMLPGQEAPNETAGECRREIQMFVTPNGMMTTYCRVRDDTGACSHFLPLEEHETDEVPERSGPEPDAEEIVHL